MLALVAMLTISSTVMAQDEQGKREGGHRQMDKTEMVKHRTDAMVQKYGLNTDQAKQLLDLNTEYADKIRAARFGGGPRGQHHGAHHQGIRGKKPEMKDSVNKPERPQFDEEKMKTLREQSRQAMQEYETKLQSIMTAEQFEAYKADMAKERKERPNRPRPHRN